MRMGGTDPRGSRHKSGRFERKGVSGAPGMERLVLRPLAADDAGDLRRIHATPEVARWWDVPHDDFPSSDDPDATRLTIEFEGAVAGLIQFSEEPEPKYRHASIDLFLDPQFHDRGIGTEAVQRVVRHLIDECGHHRITIDPAAANSAAIRAYEKAGSAQSVCCASMSGTQTARGWHDALLMELLAGEERSAPPDQ